MLGHPETNVRRSPGPRALLFYASSAGGRENGEGLPEGRPSASQDVNNSDELDVLRLLALGTRGHLELDGLSLFE